MRISNIIVLVLALIALQGCAASGGYVSSDIPGAARVIASASFQARVWACGRSDGGQFSAQIESWEEKKGGRPLDLTERGYATEVVCPHTP